MIANAHLDFGYPWWLSYGHLPLVAGSGLLLALGFWRKWPIWAIILLSPLFLWSSTAFLASRFVININGVTVGATTAYQGTEAGRIDLTANVKNDPTPATATFLAENGATYTIKISGSPPALTITSP